MPSHVPFAENEYDNLRHYLTQQRDTFKYIAHDLTDAQARMRPTSGELSIGGLIKHIAMTERVWMALIEQRDFDTDSADGFTMRPDETLSELLSDLDACGRESNEILNRHGPDDPVPVPEAPWNPKDVDSWSVRWVLGHLIEETARHAGHGDIIREAIDGKTMYELQSIVDGWHAQYLEMMRRFGD